jgi:para-aminobenzoate synthetase component II
MPRVFLIDNYDSFTYNVVQLIGEIGAEINVGCNDKVTIAGIEAARPTHLVVSPGPCTPNEAGISMDAIEHFGRRLPVLGICLGHQAIAQVYGGLVHRGSYPVHGKTGEVHHDGRTIFAGLPQPFTATRYHSLVVDPQLPARLELTAWLDDGVVMGVRHRELPVEGVQFHPESVLTEVGEALMRNFLGVPGDSKAARRRPEDTT